jgi:hypothetical protein
MYSIEAIKSKSNQMNGKTTSTQQSAAYLHIGNSVAFVSPMWCHSWPSAAAGAIKTQKHQH